MGNSSSSIDAFGYYQESKVKMRRLQTRYASNTGLEISFAKVEYIRRNHILTGTVHGAGHFHAVLTKDTSSTWSAVRSYNSLSKEGSMNEHSFIEIDENSESDR